MSIVKNDELYKLNDKIKDIDPGTLSTLGQNNQASLDILLSRVGGVMSSVGADKWNSSVRDVIQKYLDGSFKDSIAKAKQSSQLVADASGHVSNLKSICGQYVEQFDKYTTEKGRSVTQYVEGSTTEYTQEYINWQSNIRAYENSIPKLEEEALRIKKAVISYFSSVDFSNNTVNASVFTAGSTDITINFADYFNGQLKIIKEEFKVKNQETKVDPTTGNLVTESEYSVEREYADGSKGTGDGNEKIEVEDANKNNQLDKGENFTHTVNETGTIETPDGQKYDYTHDLVEDNIGVVSEDTTVKDQETKDVVYDKDVKREVQDDTSGYECVETSTEETTGSSKTYSWNSSYYLDGEYDTAEREETYTLTVNGDGTGAFTRADGKTSEYYRGEDNKLYVKQDGRSREVDESVTKKFVIKKNGVTVVEMDVNPNSGLDQARMRYEIDKARAEHGTGVASMESTEELVQRMSNEALGYASDFYSNGIRDDKELYEWGLE